MNVLIITKSFVREVCALIEYAARYAPDIKFHVISPAQYPPKKPVPGSLYKLYWAHHIRAAWYPPGVLSDLRRFHPDIVQVFEEFSSLIAFQTLIFRHLAGQSAKTMIYAAENIPGNIHPLFRLPARYVLRHADLAFVCSQGVAAVMRREGFARPIRVFPLGVDTTRFSKLSAPALKTRLQLDGAWVMGYVGRLLAIKGVISLVTILSRLPDQVHLLMIGSGPEEQNLRMAIARHRLERRVHLVGDVPYDELPQYINCMDVGIAPSRTTARWKEQFGRVLAEYMSCGIPVIGSDSGSIPEVIGDAGVIFPEHDPEQLIPLINGLRQSPQRCQNLGQRGRARVAARYSLDLMCRQFLAMYAELLPPTC